VPFSSRFFDGYEYQHHYFTVIVYQELEVLFSYTAFTDKVERKCHFPALRRTCTPHSQALGDFPDAIPVTLHKNNDIIFPSSLFCSSSAENREVKFAFNFAIERTVK
jgi:hypothetical protein